MSISKFADVEASAARISYSIKPNFWAELAQEVDAYATDPLWFTALANVAASLKHHLPDVNWAGFYLMKDGELVLGPFQGLPACTRIAVGKGVCGTAVSTKTSQLVIDVDAFPGHITCDGASRSEIVAPLILEGRVIGVIDIDSPTLARFDGIDLVGLETLASIIVKRVLFPKDF